MSNPLAHASDNRSRRTYLLQWCAVVVFALLAPGRLLAQSQTSPRWELGAYVGAAYDSPVGSHLGIIPNRDHLFLGIHIAASLIRRERWTFAWAPEVVPLLVVSDNPRYRKTGDPLDHASYDVGGFLYEAQGYVPLGEGPVTGFAVSPIGFEGQRRVASRWRLYAAGAAGVVWFTRDVPLPGARSFNYTIEYGGGALWQVSPDSALRFGYKFHHLSNWYSSTVNPGLDGNVFLVGWQRSLS